MHGSAGQDPSHVRPPFAVAGGMRVTVFVRKLVMNAMGRDPENRPTLERQRRAPGEEVFDPFWSLVSPMGQQPVIAHADAKAPGNPPQEHGNEECLPRKEK